VTSRTFTRRALLTAPYTSFALHPSDILYTPIAQFYREPRTAIPYVDREHWHLGIWRGTQSLASYSFANLAAYPTHSIDATLCSVNAHSSPSLIGHARWEGIPLRTLLPTFDNSDRFARVMGMDGRSATLTREQLERSLVAFRMNGEPLPAEQGYPARLIVPGLYDDKMPRWVTRIELRQQFQSQYEQSSSIDSNVRAFARFDQPRSGQSVSRQVRLSGIAYAGLRRVVAVEISVDDGDWMPVAIGKSEPGCWTAWTADWYAPISGNYTLAVRAIDEYGFEQPDPQRTVIHVDSP
jgi:DMSO/TMAO reductase YedYZ molybdopterin-dependent catalytic subunit